MLKKKVAKISKAHTSQIEVFELVKREKSQNKFCDTIERCVILREHFYDMLVDTEPEYDKFVMLGFAIKQASSRIKAQWRSLKKSNSRLSLRMLATYSGYHEQILQDLEKAAKLRSSMLEEGIVAEGDILTQYSDGGSSVVAVTMNAQGEAIIVKHNCAFSELSGYTKDELTNTAVEKVVPRVLQPLHHRGFDYAEAQVRNERPMNFTHKATLMLHKSGYLVPIVHRVVATPNYINGYSFIAKLGRDKGNNSYNVLHFLTDESRNIVNVSSSRIQPNANAL